MTNEAETRNSKHESSLQNDIGCTGKVRQHAGGYSCAMCLQRSCIPHACMWLLREKYKLSCWVGLSLPFSSFLPLPRNMAVGITVCFHKKTQVRDYMHLRVQARHLVYEAHYPRTL